MADNRPIGIFDSGIGGLTVAKAITDELPNEEIIYFGDTAHLPYGDKSPEAVRQYSERISEFLLEQGSKAIVIACNTASSHAYNHLKNILDPAIPVINVIDPVVDAVAKSKNKKIGIIGTKGTIRANMYALKLMEKMPGVEVASLATGLLAPLVEEGFAGTEVSRTVITRYLSSERLNEIDSIVLACTHYPLLEKEIEEYYNHRVTVIDCASIVSHFTREILGRKGLLTGTGKPGKHRFYVSDFSEFFEKTASRFFPGDIHLEFYPVWSAE